jgi:hypothetical protein
MSIFYFFRRDIIMDDRELSFSKSEDEQSEMSNHDYDQDIKPVIPNNHNLLIMRNTRPSFSDSHYR